MDLGPRVDQPVPSTAVEAAERFHCLAYSCKGMRGDDCAKRFRGANGGQGESRASLKCEGCPAGAARALLLLEYTPPKEHRPSNPAADYWRQEERARWDRSRARGAGKGIDWPSYPLGKRPDPEIARKAGCTPAAVKAARKKLGIPAYVPHRPSPVPGAVRRQAGAPPQVEPVEPDPVQPETVARLPRRRSPAAEDARDAQIARRRLAEIAADPSAVVRGQELQARLAGAADQIPTTAIGSAKASPSAPAPEAPAPPPDPDHRSPPEPAAAPGPNPGRGEPAGPGVVRRRGVRPGTPTGSTAILSVGGRERLRLRLEGEVPSPMHRRLLEIGQAADQDTGDQAVLWVDGRPVFGVRVSVVAARELVEHVARELVG